MEERTESDKIKSKKSRKLLKIVLFIAVAAAFIFFIYIATAKAPEEAKAGDFVKKDTILAKIDDAPFRQQMLQAQAAYLASKSTASVKIQSSHAESA